MEAVSEAAMRELDDEALGWFRRALPWGSYGMLARASLSAPTLGVALKRWCRHHGLLTDDITLALHTDGEAARIAAPNTARRRPRQRSPSSASSRCCATCSAWPAGWWIRASRCKALAFRSPRRRTWTPTACCSTAPPVRRPRAALRLDARYLALPIRRDEAAMNQMLQRALPLTVLPYRRDRLLVQRVRQVLASQPLDSHNASDLAALLNLSARTLHRQLKEEGASLQALKDEVRRDRATELLQRTNRPVKQVALAVGFREREELHPRVQRLDGGERRGSGEGGDEARDGWFRP